LADKPQTIYPKKKCEKCGSEMQIARVREGWVIVLVEYRCPSCGAEETLLVEPPSRPR